ncbi:MAG: BtrH N-terminal domain-containing protein [Euryarchaeota archaeon]|nr:BtrH N-terminal domain-containing protein [Euryarchaeota archaeon]
MEKLVEGFAHKPGVHCITSALRDAFEYHGFKFSEEMVFGLDWGYQSWFMEGHVMAPKFLL